jgi:hypothetical protein
MDLIMEIKTAETAAQVEDQAKAVQLPDQLNQGRVVTAQQIYTIHQAAVVAVKVRQDLRQLSA